MESKAITTAKTKVRHGVYLNIPDKRYATFKKKAFAKFDKHKGSVTKALEEAISLWIKEN